MAPRSQPHRLEFPLDASQVEALDGMLQDLYDDIGNDSIFPTKVDDTVLKVEDGEIVWDKVDLTIDVEETLPVSSGGTGATTFTGVLVGNGTGAVTAVALSGVATEFFNGVGAFSVPSGVSMARIMTRVVLGI